jgi:2-(3-amino-3-carboxypropyl)histidine synthase
VLDVSISIREDQIARIIAEQKPKKIGIQAPDGLLNVVMGLAERLEQKHAVETMILFDPSYGTCDLMNLDAKRLGLDLILNLGHSVGVGRVGKFTYLVDVEYNVDFKPVLDQAIGRFKGAFSKVGVVTISNHKAQLDMAIAYLNEKGLHATKGESEGVLFDGQVFGCNYYSAKNIAKDVEAFFFLGQSRFHAVGVRLNTRKPTYMLDPFFNLIEDMAKEAEHMERKAILSVLKAKDAEKIGIVVSMKEGQLFRKQADEVKSKLNRLGKKTYLFHMREVTPQRIAAIRGVDAFVETACPRVALDNEEFDRPVLSYEQALGLIRLLEGRELGDMFGSGFWV